MIAINWHDRGKLALLAFTIVTAMVVAVLELTRRIAPTVSHARYVGFCLAIWIVAALVARWVLLKYRD